MSLQYKIFFASSNKDKLKEIKSILRPEASPRRRGSPKAADLRSQITIRSAPKGFKVRENGKTFLENAYIKASKLSKKLKVIAFSDDSGIEVFALGRKPGVKSSRYFKNGQGMLKIIEKLKNKKNRSCCFTCALVATNAKGKVIFKTQKSWYGKVAEKPVGKNGFGYDPIFIVPKLKKTSAQIPASLKNKLSHRTKAIKAFALWLKSKVCNNMH